MDFRHWFFHFPEHPDEMRYLATRFGDDWLVWLRATQGSRGAPLISGRGIALVMRLATSVVPTDHVRSSTYVDDPILTFVGADAENDGDLAKIVLCLRALNFSLSYDKAQYSKYEPIVTWTSARFEVTKGYGGLEVTINGKKTWMTLRTTSMT